MSAGRSFKLTIRTPSGQTTTLPFTPRATVDRVKKEAFAEIRELSSCSPSDYVLVGPNNQALTVAFTRITGAHEDISRAVANGQPITLTLVKRGSSALSPRSKNGPEKISFPFVPSLTETHNRHIDRVSPRRERANSFAGFSPRTQSRLSSGTMVRSKSPIQGQDTRKASPSPMRRGSGLAPNRVRQRSKTAEGDTTRGRGRGNRRVMRGGPRGGRRGVRGTRARGRGRGVRGGPRGGTGRVARGSARGSHGRGNPSRGGPAAAKPVAKTHPVVTVQSVDTTPSSSPAPVRAATSSSEDDPSIWKTYKAENGSPYYFNTVTRETTWIKPAAIIKAELASIQSVPVPASSPKPVAKTTDNLPVRSHNQGSLSPAQAMASSWSHNSDAKMRRRSMTPLEAAMAVSSSGNGHFVHPDMTASGTQMSREPAQLSRSDGQHSSVPTLPHLQRLKRSEGVVLSAHDLRSSIDASLSGHFTHLKLNEATPEGCHFVPRTGFQFELGNNGVPPHISRSTIQYEFPEESMLMYRDLFVDSDHENYLGDCDAVGPFAVSLSNVKAGEHIPDMEQDLYKKGGLRALVRTNRGAKLVYLTKAQLKSKEYSGKKPAERALWAALHQEVPKKCIHLVKDHGLVDGLLSHESGTVVRKFKFGVLYGKQGQTTEDDMYCNEYGSQYFEEFLDFLGDRVPLHEWTEYRGGLDVRTGTTGTHSVYSEFKHGEIMFHVSTLLPYTPGDEQQIERKRHLGNDIVMIIFMDGDTPFDVNCVASEFNHIFFVVRRDESSIAGRETKYRIQVASKDSVPFFGPELVSPSVYTKDSLLREWFLAKLVNSERAAYKSPQFSTKIRRTHEQLLQHLIKQFVK